jgi:hypothetical protein
LVVSIVHRAKHEYGTDAATCTANEIQNLSSLLCTSARIESSEACDPHEVSIYLWARNLSSSMGTYLAPFEPYGRQPYKLIFYDHTRRVQQLNLVFLKIDVHVSTKCLEHTPGGAGDLVRPYSRCRGRLM